ncbi:MAG: serine/threonine protein phosphatase [Planctomycetaceae bacterium]|nr:serine/threonine protein phosphatase [Planctomycetaceae bacterium]
MSGRLIAVGDIHGCDAAFAALLGAIAPQPTDRIILLGDLVDRGPDSRGVIDRILQLRATCQVDVILGNHEEMMLQVIDGRAPEPWLNFGGVQTLDSYGFVGSLDVLPASHVELIRQAHDFVETERHFFTHANYDPRQPLNKQTVAMLRWNRLDTHFPGPHASGKIAVVGHTPDKGGEVFQVKHLICLDTYCYGGGYLTAMDLGSGQTWQAHRDGTLRG